MLACADESDQLEVARKRSGNALSLALIARACVEPALQVALSDVRIVYPRQAIALVAALRTHPLRARWVRELFVGLEDGTAVVRRTTRSQLTAERLGEMLAGTLALRLMALSVTSDILVELTSPPLASTFAQPHPFLHTIVLGIGDTFASSADMQRAVVRLATAFRDTLVILSVGIHTGAQEETDLPPAGPFPRLKDVSIGEDSPSQGLVLAIVNAAPALAELAITRAQHAMAGIDHGIASRLVGLTLVDAASHDDLSLDPSTLGKFSALVTFTVAGLDIGLEHLQQLPKSIEHLAFGWAIDPDDLLVYVADTAMSPNLRALRFEDGLVSYTDEMGLRWLAMVQKVGEATDERGITFDLQIAPPQPNVRSTCCDRLLIAQRDNYGET